MAYISKNYKPNKKSRAILDRAMQLIEGVPYQVTARWLFYGLLQEGFYRGKGDYKGKFLPLLSRARHNFYQGTCPGRSVQGWRPDTLSDDRRVAIVRGDGFETPGAWARAVAEQGKCKLSRWEGQDYYVELWFEAEAMIGQFRYYTKSITLRPFFGMPSIPYKFDIAKALERADENYGMTIIILYFGDWDPGGQVIPETSVADIRRWCDVEFEYIRVGLNEGDADKYGLPESVDRPGAYQWEALGDDDARQMITGAVGRYVDGDKMTMRANLEQQTTTAFREHLLPWAERMEGEP